LYSVHPPTLFPHHLHSLLVPLPQTGSFLSCYSLIL
jgi:hypothetical protein